MKLFKQIIIFVGLKLYEIIKGLVKWIGLIVGIVVFFLVGILSLLFILGFITYPIWNIIFKNNVYNRLIQDDCISFLSDYVNMRIQLGLCSVLPLMIVGFIIYGIYELIDNRYEIKMWLSDNWEKARRIANRK